MLALQWGVGGAFLLRRSRPLAVAVGVPTLYLWVVDRIAIADGVWTVAAETSTGVHLLGLPVEEAVFFLVTSALVVNGLVLFEWALRRFHVVAHVVVRLGRVGDGDDARDEVASESDQPPIAD
ncbi:lycopene cyclase domain-containing protein [Halobaculum halobium]|uniref:Lycopene cyclase domain-containing protein n=1 Tax=Halobaculum halobium TaxID=3032281 RepID=A0ABD5TCB2_9EURY|nr:lycopene cyclase domain-containing protein [Halobaculum sp. SYNS20]